MGRENWMKRNGVSMDDLYMVREFAEKTVDSYGGAVIQKLLDRINKQENQHEKKDGARNGV